MTFAVDEEEEEEVEDDDDEGEGETLKEILVSPEQLPATLLSITEIKLSYSLPVLINDLLGNFICNPVALQLC